MGVSVIGFIMIVSESKIPFGGLKHISERTKPTIAQKVSESKIPFGGLKQFRQLGRQRGG